MKTLSRDEIISEGESVPRLSFRDAAIAYHHFANLDFGCSIFQDVHLDESTFEWCEFHSSRFIDCQSTSCFRLCNFSNANFSDCKFRKGFDSCSLFGVHFRNCDFEINPNQYASCSFVRCSFEKCRLFDEEINSPPLSLTGLRWPVLITPRYMAIGCQRYTHERWEAFTDTAIVWMDCQAKGFWHQHRKMLLDMCKEKANG